MKLRTRLWQLGRLSTLMSLIVLVGFQSNSLHAQDKDASAEKSEAKKDDSDQKESADEPSEDDAEMALEELDDQFDKAYSKFRKSLTDAPAKDRAKFFAEKNPMKTFGTKYLALYETYRESDQATATKALTQVITRGLGDDKEKAAGLVLKNHAKNISLLRTVGSARGVNSKTTQKTFQLMMDNFGDQAGTLQLVATNATGELKEKALNKLLNDFSDSEALVSAMVRMTRAPESETTEKFLRSAAEKSENDRVKGVANYVLAKYLISHSPDDSEDEITTILEMTSEKFGDEVYSTARKTKLKTVIGPELFAFKNLRIGKMAPNIEGKDIDGKSFKLSDYRGKVVMIDFWGDW